MQNRNLIYELFLIAFIVHSLQWLYQHCTHHHSTPHFFYFYFYCIFDKVDNYNSKHVKKKLGQFTGQTKQII